MHTYVFMYSTKSNSSYYVPILDSTVATNVYNTLLCKKIGQVRQ